MKLFLSLAAFLALVANSALAATPPAKPTCPEGPSASMPLLRADRPKDDHFYSTDSSQVDAKVKGSGYRRMASVGNVFTKQLPGTVALHRLYLTGKTDFTYTTSDSERKTALDAKYHDENVVGYLLQYGGCSYPGYQVLPLYRLYNKRHTSHMLISDAAAKAVALKSGYTENGTLGYVVVPY